MIVFTKRVGRRACELLRDVKTMNSHRISALLERCWFMASSREHQTKAEKIAAFLGDIAPTPHNDWKIVAAFYTAVHLVERLRAFFNEHSENHHARNMFLKGQQLK